MLLKLLISVFFSISLNVSALCQNEETKSAAERQVDSLLQYFINEQGANPQFEEGIDSAKLEQAEKDYMENFLKLKRDPERELLLKTTLQVVIGLVLFTGLFIAFKKRKRK